MLQLVDIRETPEGHKKRYIATFQIDKYKYKNVYFGSKLHSNYTLHKDKDRRNRYIQRHLKDLKTNDPMRPGYLSMYILWNKPTLKASISDYKKRLQEYDRSGLFKTEIE